MAGQLTRIVEHFEALRSVPDELLAETSDLPPTPLRSDVAVPFPSPETTFSNAPEISHGHFVVPRVVARGE
jgi:aspartyl/glutamyl-tRNA(Asn/Gln) amidotransferase C subunit